MATPSADAQGAQPWSQSVACWPLPWQRCLLGPRLPELVRVPVGHAQRLTDCTHAETAAAMNRKKLQKLTDTLTRNCKHFNTFEVNCLVKLFYNLVGDVVERPGMVIGLDRNAFRNILHMTFGMTDDMIMDRVFRGFDKDNDGCVSVTEWINGLSVFLRGSLEEKMKYCFEVFDLNGDGFISKEEMFHMLKNSLLKQPSEEDPDEGIKDLVEITLKKMDHDHDGKLSFADYEKAVWEETLLLEAFGPCLPDPKSQMEFEAQVFKDPNEFNDM